RPSLVTGPNVPEQHRSPHRHKNRKANRRQQRRQKQQCHAGNRNVYEAFDQLFHDRTTSGPSVGAESVLLGLGCATRNPRASSSRIYSCASASQIRSCLNSRRTRSRPALPMAAASSLSFRSRSKPLANASESPTGTRTPFTPSITASTTPVALVPTTGLPAAWASEAAFGNPSR